MNAVRFQRAGALRLQKSGSQKGSVLIEFVFILPVFLLLLFGTISFSVALYNKTILTMATREGARAGVKFVKDRTDAMIVTNATDTVEEVCSQKLISFGVMDDAVAAAAINGDILTVSAGITYTGLYIFSELPISAQTSMRIE